MHKQYSADIILNKTKEYWPETDQNIDSYAIYLHRSQQLSLKLATQIIQRHQVNTSEFDVLAALRNTAPPHQLTPTELQRSMLITSGGLTKLLYQLEARGLITRSVKEHDKRSKLVHLTETGKNLVEECMVEVHAFDRKLLNTALTAKELTQFITLLSKVTRTLEKKDGQFTFECSQDS
ncbi:MAG: MarR family transcriptional regulator [Candidatus Thiodiazotropha sp. L084R]